MDFYITKILNFFRFLSPFKIKYRLFKWVLIFFSEKLLLELLKITFLLLPKHLFFLGPGCKVGKMAKSTFSKKIKKIFFLDDCDGFFSCLWSTTIRLIKNSNQTPGCHRPKAKKNKKSKTCQSHDFEVGPSGNFFI